VAGRRRGKASRGQGGPAVRGVYAGWGRGVHAALHESEGKKVGEEEDVARNLTVHSNRAKEGRERELDEGAKLRAATIAAAVV